MKKKRKEEETRMEQRNAVSIKISRVAVSPDYFDTPLPARLLTFLRASKA